MPSTTYEVKVNGETVETRSKRDKAIAVAEALDAVGTIEVVTNAGTVVHTIERGEAGTHFKPWTRVEQPTKFEAPAIAGYTPAYVRNRVKAIVYRANDRSGWLVLDTVSDARTECKTTAEAREVTNAMAVAHKEAKEAAAAEAKAAKEAAKAEAAA